MAHHFGKITGWGDVGPSRTACHWPDGVFPFQLLLRGWEGALVAEEGPVDRLGLSDNAPLFLIVRLVSECIKLCIPDSVRSRLQRPR
jgi:hypothetical protein